MTGSGRETSDDDNDILKEIPNKLKISARSLLIFLKDKKILKINSEGKFYIKSSELKRNTVINLLIHALTNIKKKPKYYKLFYKEIKKFKLPNFLKINNLKRYTNEPNVLKWRPPRQLYKEVLNK